MHCRCISVSLLSLCKSANLRMFQPDVPCSCTFTIMGCIRRICEFDNFVLFSVGLGCTFLAGGYCGIQESSSRITRPNDDICWISTKERVQLDKSHRRALEGQAGSHRKGSSPPESPFEKWPLIGRCNITPPKIVPRDALRKHEVRYVRPLFLKMQVGAKSKLQPTENAKML